MISLLVKSKLTIQVLVQRRTSCWNTLWSTSTEFEMSLVGELTYFLGLQVRQTSNGTFISQSKYAKNLVKNFGIETAAHRRTPARTHAKISRDEGGKDVDQTLYRSMIGRPHNK